MAEAKTKPTEQTPDSFLSTISDESVRKDCYTLISLIEKTTEAPATMWGPAIIGFGKYHYKYESGREGEMCIVGFSPRKANLTLYILSDFESKDELLAKLGKYKRGKGCMYIKKLSDIDLSVLESIISNTFIYMKKKHAITA